MKDMILDSIGYWLLVVFVVLGLMHVIFEAIERAMI